LTENQAIAVKVNGQLKDLSSIYSLNGDEEVEIISPKNPEGLEILRHSVAHIMAHAVKMLFPEVQVTIGPAIEDGFYYDFDRDIPFTEEDLQKIEKKMHEIIKSRQPFIRKELSKEEAIDLLRVLGSLIKLKS